MANKKSSGAKKPMKGKIAKTSRKGKTEEIVGSQDDPTGKKPQSAEIGSEIAPEFDLIVAGPKDPLGACVWYDTTGQPHCTTTTLSLCTLKKGRFYVSKACPGGL
jgi:hypothetical protein